jgi:hypothetical protein
MRSLAGIRPGCQARAALGPDYDLAVSASNWALAMGAARLREPR